MRPRLPACLQAEVQVLRQPFLRSYSWPSIPPVSWRANSPGFVICHLLPRHPPGHRLLPILSIKRVRLDRRDIDIVETADIDVDLVGIGARHIEGMDAADRAEGVLGRAGIELISGQRVRA